MLMPKKDSELMKNIELRYSPNTEEERFTTVQKILCAMGFACLTGLLAQLRIPLPWTPVPITGQTCAVLLSGIVLGSLWGGLSQVIYLGLGIAGVPWFSGGRFGVQFIIGPTGGYVLGFILCSILIGYITKKLPIAQNFWALFLAMMFGNFLCIHLIGMIQLGLWQAFIFYAPKTMWQIMRMGWIPFIVGDLIKTALVAIVSRHFFPQRKL